MNDNLKTNLITGILGCPIIYIPHFQYQHIDETIMDIAEPVNGRNILGINANMVCEYSQALGVTDFRTKEKDRYWRVSLEGLLETIVGDKTNELNGCKIFVLKNIAKELQDPTILALLQLFAEKYESGMIKDSLTTIIIVSPVPSQQLPAEIESLVSVIDILPPTLDEIHRYVATLPVTKSIVSPRGKEMLINDICRNLQGLQLYDIRQILRLGLSRTGGVLSDKTCHLVLEEKKKVVRKTGIVEVVDTDVSFEDIGGLDNLRTELERKATIYHHLREAIESRITLPKGILIIGMPGCGKSMIAKAVAEKFGVSLLRLDISRLMGQYVGQSETNLRRALATAEAAHPCVLWIDEIEKAFAGSGGGNSGGNEDMLVMRLMGHFLTWMQERKTPVYIVATANDTMRPEFMRKGRFDEVYFVNFPTQKERADILTKKLRKYEKSHIFNLSPLKDKIMDIVASMQGRYGGFSGAEIESVVNTVFEQKFMLYMEDIEKHGNDDNYEPPLQDVTPEDFILEVTRIKASVMSEQVSKAIDIKENIRNKTNIERIRDMQRTYHFVPATKGNDVSDND